MTDDDPGVPGLSGARARTLRALCDTFVAAVAPPRSQAGDPTGFWGRFASDVDAPAHVADHVLHRLGGHDRDGMLRLLDLLGGLGFSRLPHAARESLVRTLAHAGQVGDGLDAYRKLTILNAYARADADGHNPNWRQLAYPGPPVVETPPDDRLATYTPPTGTDPVELSCDVVVVGSGAGGSVVAAVVAATGRDVVVLEAGGHHDAASFPHDEVTALQELFWRGAAVPTSDGTVSLLAARTLGGGTTVNWQNCVRPPAEVRKAWAADFGLDGLDGLDFDDHVDAVLERIGATYDHGDLNGPNRRLRDGAHALGWSWTPALRNVDGARYDPATAGHVGYGDRAGSKLGAIRTYLADAVAAGARLVTRCTARRVLVEGGRAAGVEAVLERPVGARTRLAVRARQVVVAGGALETPALLLRSAIGGPATGRYLRVHPVTGTGGYYTEPQEAWWGPPQTCVVDEHAGGEGDGHGFLIEVPHLHTGVVAASMPWRSARDHKLLVGRMADLTVFISINRDHGWGTVTLDDEGEAVVTYPFDDARDRDLLHRSLAAMVRLHVAAGADAVLDFHPRREVWRRGDDLDVYLVRIGRLGFGRRRRPLVSAHQMGSARIGTDPATSVADPDGQLHTTRGVWIGDASAFPTAVGANPMVTVMALARRTATRILAH